ncbi:phosphatase PAP2 family protein [Sorangium sp. So ce834]|uniref:phosphatase PAP2 family protein n=1 Tax=Sorangium sp. So ce834 TaxID=3133321 RepID=UPI003F62862A
MQDRHWTPLASPGSNGGPLHETPNFPSYHSGHASLEAAMFQVLSRYYHTNHVPFCFVSDEFNGRTTDARGDVRPGIERCYPGFRQAVHEVATSRIYLGVHWRFDAENGMRQGRAVGDAVFEGVLQPLD